MCVGSASSYGCRARSRSCGVCRVNVKPGRCPARTGPGDQPEAWTFRVGELQPAQLRPVSGFLRTRVANVQLLDPRRELPDARRRGGIGIGLQRPRAEPAGLINRDREVEAHSDPWPGAIPIRRRSDLDRQRQSLAGQPPEIATSTNSRLLAALMRLATVSARSAVSRNASGTPAGPGLAPASAARRTGRAHLRRRCPRAPPTRTIRGSRIGRCRSGPRHSSNRGPVRSSSYRLCSPPVRPSKVAGPRTIGSSVAGCRAGPSGRRIGGKRSGRVEGELRAATT